MSGPMTWTTLWGCCGERRPPSPGALHLDLGPVATFVPASPVVYLAVGGPDFDRLARLRHDVMSGPFCGPTGGPGCLTSPSPIRSRLRRPRPL